MFPFPYCIASHYFDFVYHENNLAIILEILATSFFCFFLPLVIFSPFGGFILINKKKTFFLLVVLMASFFFTILLLFHLQWSENRMVLIVILNIRISMRRKMCGWHQASSTSSTKYVNFKFNWGHLHFLFFVKNMELFSTSENMQVWEITYSYIRFLIIGKHMCMKWIKKGGCGWTPSTKLL